MHPFLVYASIHISYVQYIKYFLSIKESHVNWIRIAVTIAPKRNTVRAWGIALLVLVFAVCFLSLPAVQDKIRNQEGAPRKISHD